MPERGENLVLEIFHPENRVNWFILHLYDEFQVNSTIRTLVAPFRAKLVETTPNNFSEEKRKKLEKFIYKNSNISSSSSLGVQFFSFSK